MSDNILLCDIGGTHARFAKFERKGAYSNFKKYRLNDFESFEDIVQKYYDEMNLKWEHAYIACARKPIDGKIHYKRHAGDPDFEIDFNVIQSHFKWADVTVLNDLSAGTYGLSLLENNDIETIITDAHLPFNDSKCLISVGTGIGHCGIHNGQILDTPGGHWYPVIVTKAHRDLADFINDKKDNDLALIMEDFVCGRGLKSITHFISGIDNDTMSPDEFMTHLRDYPKAVTLFFEYLGLYAHNLVNMTGFYGGVYITGGVIDHLTRNNLTDWNAFETFFKPKMVQSVEYRLNGCPVHYVLHDELPLLGLTAIETP